MIIIGHRGARGLAPENTLEAFQKAIDCEVAMIETDVRLTKDGQLVLVHDDHLLTADKRELRVIDVTHQTLKDHHDAIVTLDEAITFINRRTRLMIEVKKGVPTAPVITVVRQYLKKGWQPGDFMFNSSEYTILRELYRTFPDIERVIQGNWSGMRVQYLARKLKTPYILLDQRYVWWGYVYLVSKRFKLITYTYPWTNSARYNHFRAEKWGKYGLYGLVTDYPDHFQK